MFGLARRTHNIGGDCGLTKPPLIPWLEVMAIVDLDGIAFPIFYAMVKSSQNPETIIVKAKSNYHTNTGTPLPIGGATGHTLMHKDTRLSGMDRLTKPLLIPCLEAKAPVDVNGIAFQIWYPIGNSAAWIFLYSYNLSRIYIFQWFAMFGGIRHHCLQLYYVPVYSNQNIR